MNFTKSPGLTIHAGTGNAMHDDTKDNATVLSSDDINSLIWSLTSLAKRAGLALTDFDPDNANSYDWIHTAITKLFVGNPANKIKGAIATTDYELVNLKLLLNKLENYYTKTAVNKTITDLSKTQVNRYTGFDDMPLFSISPMMHYGVNSYFSLSKKWTYCNGAAVAIGANTFTLAQTEQYLKSNFVKHFNNSIVAITNVPVGSRPKQIKLGGSASDYSIGGSSHLWIPNLWGAGLFFRAGGGGHMSGDAIRNITASANIHRGLNGQTGAFFSTNDRGSSSGNIYSYGDFRLTFNASRVVPTAPENRPANINMPVYFKIN